MSIKLVLFLFEMFIVKHFVVDFLLQTPYQYQNKHILGHPGGILHSFLHGITSWVILGIIFEFFNSIIVVAVVVEFILHYFIDFFKMNFNIKYNLTPMNPKFWYVLGFDQLLHYLTYLGMIYFLLIAL